MSLTKLSKDVHKLARRNGFWENRTAKDIPAALMLVVGELSEAVEELRAGRKAYYKNIGKPCGYGIEFADAILRLIDIVAFMGLDIDDLLHIKHEYNKTRPYLHGKLF